MKNVDVAVYNYLKSVADGADDARRLERAQANDSRPASDDHPSVQAGISTGTLQNGGVGLAPFHDWNSKIPADLKAQIQEASDGIKDGSITIDLP